MRFGDWNRGALVSRRGRRVLVEWWSPQIGRYRVWKFGPLELHRGVLF